MWLDEVERTDMVKRIGVGPATKAVVPRVGRRFLRIMEKDYGLALAISDFGRGGILGCMGLFQFLSSRIGFAATTAT